MIPFRTTAPCHRSPVVSVSLIFLNIAVFFYQEGLGEQAEYAFITTFALIPAVYGSPAAARDAGLDPGNLLPLISNTFLHGGYLHLIVNMWTLWLFGLPVEDRLGPFRFSALYLCCGAAGSLAHLAFNLSSQVPALGASGAIAGVLGAFVWIYPRAKVAAVVPIIVIPWIVQPPGHAVCRHLVPDPDDRGLVGHRRRPVGRRHRLVGAHRRVRGRPCPRR
ncbi:MAG TPA: rhomboid family intramembrane serine protease, partial [Rhodospirillales bacterium]|nr:rhomboid family intramembrane serine protease [Rhodospirillales bacterium]